MTLTEAIKHCEDVADYDCFTDDQQKCSEEHRQLADWLRELKERREKAQLSGEDATFDCISRQAAIDALHMDTSIIPFEKAREYADATISEIRNRLEKLPSAQPEIIRCRDCKHHDGIRCFRWNSTIITGFDDFCSNAERRSEEE